MNKSVLNPTPRQPLLSAGRYRRGSRLLAAGLAPLCVSAITPLPADASYGPFLHGDGIQSLGFGGVSQVAGDDSYTLAGNPAMLSRLGDRYDFGLDFERVAAGGTIHGNLLGPDRDYESSFVNVPVPQFGVVRELNDDFSVGTTGFVLGFGTSYHDSPFQRFGGAPKSNVTIGLVGLSNALAWRPIDGQTVALALNLSYQIAEVKGLAPLGLFSVQPQKISDNGRNGAAGIGYTLGWHGDLTPWLEAGVSYHSQTWAQRFDQYAGLFPDAGLLEFPARYAGGLALRPWPWLTLAAEGQRVLYADQHATGNLGVEKLNSGKRFGSTDGPGFGWRNQTIFKFGAQLQCTPQLALRGGYSRGTQITRPSETLLSILAPATIGEHYTAGASFERRDGWQITGYLMYAPRLSVQGDHSIPIYLGGGEADAHNSSTGIGLSFGRHFD